MKKLIKILLTILLFFVSFNPVFAQKTEKIAVFPVYIPVAGTSYSLYPNILTLISGDIVNSLSKQPFIKVIDLTSSEDMINSTGLYKKYRKFLYEYKTTYAIDYDTCALIAQKMGVGKILLVSGGFDLQKMMMERSWLYRFDIPFGSPLIPSYRLNIVLTLIDPQNGQVIWENTYNKNFETKNFTLSSQYFSENVVSTEKIKKFSNKLSLKASSQISGIFNPKEDKKITSKIVTENETPKIESVTKDGVMTKDGHFSSSNYLMDKRKSDYKNWVKQNTLN